jgi:dTMP kinase
MLYTADTFNIKRKNGFIVLEGVNGAGKTTVKKHIITELNIKNIPHVATFEPGDTPTGKKIREILLGTERDIKSSTCELLLFAADRAEHVQNLIHPALQENKLVICDRYKYSTLAFQGYGRNLDKDIINRLNEIATDNLVPDFIILLDIDPALGLKRNKKASEQNPNEVQDALEKEALDFHTNIRSGFLEIARLAKEPFVVIDSTKSKELVLQEVDQVMNFYLSK